jgi:GT2 family glycosyltransferase
MNGENMYKENKKETVCAVVVTYNRKNLLLECLEAIRRQTRPVDGIYIIDNASDDGTPELLKEKGYIPELPPFNISESYEIEHKISNLVDGNPIKVFYVRMHENTGGAGGFYEGVKRGYERGYDWLWLMDDDGLPEKDCLMNLYKCIDDLNIVGSLVVTSDNSSELACKMRVVDSLGNFIPRSYFSNVEEVRKQAKNGIYYGLPNFFNSILIKKEVIAKVGFPNKESFYMG